MDKVDEADGLMVVVFVVPRMAKKDNKTEKDNKWCSFQKTSSHSDAECFTQQKKAPATRYNGRQAKRAEATQVEEAASDYPYSDEECKNEECKEVMHMLATQPKHPPPICLRSRISKAKEKLLALVVSGCSTSFIKGSLLKSKSDARSQATTSTVTFEQVDESVKSIESTQLKYRFSTLSASSLITHSFAVILNAKDERVIGRDLLCALGMIVTFRDAQIEWAGNNYKLNLGSKRSPLGVVEPSYNELKEINQTIVKSTDLLVDAQVHPYVRKQFIELPTEY
ncbi:unnamed protein product [Peronospora effusa]|nr:unnamed protein product [Peronospora effusa]